MRDSRLSLLGQSGKKPIQNVMALIILSFLVMSINWQVMKRVKSYQIAWPFDAGIQRPLCNNGFCRSFVRS